MASDNTYISPQTRPDETDRESAVLDPRVWVELEVERHVDPSCPVAGLSGTDANGTIQLTGTQCHATISFGDQEQGDISLFTATMDETCTCTTVCGPGVTPVSLRVEDGVLVVGAYVADRDRLTTIVESLRESEDEWHLRRLTSPERNAEVEAGIAGQLFENVPVTEKQREAVEAAVEMGYYAEPREASLSDLAARLGVSRSALSQRLNAVETKLVESLAAEL